MRPCATIPDLYGCPPIGRGTSDVESLVSFLSRLCVRRYALVTDVVDRVLRPYAPPGFFLPRSALSSFLNSMALRFDSHGEYASTMVEAMEGATMRSGLRVMTLLPWSGLFEDKRVSPLAAGKHRRWCASCFAKWAQDGVPLREPLLWRLHAVTRCPEHATSLRDSCPRCGARQGPLAMRVPVGVCRRCGHPLYEECHRDVPALDTLDADERWAHSRALAIARMVEVAQSTIPSRDGFARLLTFALGFAATHGLTKRQLALALGVPPPTFYAWCEQRSFPSLAQCVDASLQLGSDPAEVMCPGFDPDDCVWPPPGDPTLAGVNDVWQFALQAREYASERKHPDWARELDARATDQFLPNMERVADMLGTCRAVLETSFPVRYARLRADRVRRNSDLRADARERARLALETAIAAGGTITGFQAARSVSMNEAGLAEHWPDLYRRLREIITGRISSKNPDLIRRGHRALKAALSTPRGLTSSEVARSLGVTPAILQRACPEAWRKLIELRREERRVRHAKVRSALEAELTRSSPRSAPYICRTLGVHLADLQRHRDLYPRLIAKRCAVLAERVREGERNRAARGASAAERRALIARLDAALQAELRSPSPRSAYAIAVLHGTDSKFATRYCPDAYSRLVELRRRLPLDHSFTPA